MVTPSVQPTADGQSGLTRLSFNHSFIRLWTGSREGLDRQETAAPVLQLTASSYWPSLSKCTRLVGPTLPYKLESKHSLSCTGSPKNSSLLLTVQAHTRGRNSLPSVGSTRSLCMLSANAQRHLSIWQQEPWTSGTTATIVFADAKLLLQFVFTYVHLIAFEGFHACDGILLFLKQVLFYTAVKWTTCLKGTQNYTPCEMGWTSTSVSNTG